MQAAAHAIGQELIVVEAGSDRDIEAAFATFTQRGAGALFVGTGASLNSVGNRSLRWRPAMGCPQAMSYESSSGRRPDELRNEHNRCVPSGRHLCCPHFKGEKPADLPVQQSTKFDFLINLRTAKALGLEMPDKLSRWPTR